MSILGKNTTFKLLALVLSLVMAIGILNHSFAAASDAPESTEVTKDPLDITDYVTIHLNDFFIARGSTQLYYYKDGVLQNTSEDKFVVRMKDKAKMTYTWGVNEENIGYVQNNSYFRFKLPNQEILKSAIGNHYDILAADGSRLGFFTIEEGGFVKATLQGDFSKTNVLKDGHIEALAEFVSLDFDELDFSPKTNEVISGTTIQMVTTIKKEKMNGTYVQPGTHKYANKYKPLNPAHIFRKEAIQIGLSNKIEFTFRINHKDIVNMYHYGLSSTDTFEKKLDVQIIDDKMDERLRIIPSQTSATVYYWAPGIDQSTITNPIPETTKELSEVFLFGETNKVKDGKIMYGQKVFFDVVEGSEANIDWQGFQTQIKQMNRRVIGIWENKKIIITVGNMPFEDLVYGDHYENGITDLESKLESYGLEVNKEKYKERYLLPKQVEYMKKAYVGQPIVDFVIRFNAEPIGETEASYTNEAKMTWDKGESAYTATASMVTASGRVDVEKFQGKYSVSKEWKGTKGGPVQVQLLANGKPEGEKVTLDDSNAWRHDFLNLKEKKDGAEIQYSVEETPVENYITKVVSVKKYESVIQNYEQREIKLTKKWLDENGNLSNPKKNEVTFFLHDEKETSPTEKNALYQTTLSEATDKKQDGIWEKSIIVNKTDEDGKEIIYKVSEANVEGYTLEGNAQGSMEAGFVLSNKKNPVEKMIEDVTKIEESKKEEKEIVKTAPTTPIVPGVTVEYVYVPIPMSLPTNIVPTETGNVLESEIPSTPVVIEKTKMGQISSTDIVDPVSAPVTPPVPVSPVLIPSVSEEGIMDLDVTGDNIPRGDADIELDDEATPKGSKEIKKTKDVKEGKVLAKNEKMLAVTGGLQVIFVPLTILFSLLVLGFVALEIVARRKRR